ncbi:molybdopterin-dependent oxidoreductase [Acanthopleuribacter pedis]|uniref:Molybdopterin-dependent oxidoreductase n=1 Tax=Acanthopleuribacter pedis TaxID=442870 RepID=A0A8J7QKN6_9BACT|nr:molybdopterin-dependent oxidoreductase [Acanthopleuribacter pedis]MBO1319780.1 molybdopterin-dependent oxidoreductase [Acanthopleuribacter pedis]
MAEPGTDPVWKKSACILCSINCGLEIQTGGKNNRELVKIRGDKDNPSSRGYLCNKAQRLNYYHMGRDRIDTPKRRRPDGSYEDVSWDVAIAEVAAGLKKVKDSHGGDKILFIGGGGQGNHLGGLYSDGLQKVLGVKFRTNALAQEKTGEFWVAGKMFGGGPHGDFEHAEVAMFLGKNPWHSHGFPRTRVVLKEIARDPNRSMIVLDPCATDTAKMADFHLQVRPGTDAWVLSAMIAVILQEGLQDKAFIAQHTEGFDAIRDHFLQLSVGEYCAISELDEDLLRRAARRLATARSASIFEDLGTQQNINSTLVSYLHRVLLVITGNFAKKGAAHIAISLLSVTEASKGEVSGTTKKPRKKKVSPVLGSKVITGLLPCNEIPDEILTDHPDRFRAAIIESANPAHSYADSARIRAAIRALEFSVVVDVAMTETARLADYVLPAANAFEKHECVFFQIDYPRNTFHIRRPVADPLPGTLIEAEIHTRLIEALGALKPRHVRLLRTAAKLGRRPFSAALLGLMRLRPEVKKVLPSLLYRTLGTTLADGEAAATAPFWGLCHQFVRKNPLAAANAGFAGSPWQAGERLFDTLIGSPSGMVFCDAGSDYSETWNRVGRAGRRIQLHLEELFPRVANLQTDLLANPAEFPFVLTAGQRRAETSNTIIRDASWDKKAKATRLYMHPKDASSLALKSGDLVKITTQTGSGETHLLVTEHQRPGCVSLPNGLGVDYDGGDGSSVRIGIAPNDLTASNRKDFFAGTPWHKYVPARVEKLQDAATTAV